MSADKNDTDHLRAGSSFHVLTDAYRKAGFAVTSDTNGLERLELYCRQYKGIWPFRKQKPSKFIGSMKINRTLEREHWELHAHTQYVEQLIEIAQHHNQQYKAFIRSVGRNG